MKYPLFALMFLTLNVLGQTTPYCPPIIEKENLERPSMYTFKSATTREFHKETCKTPHPAYTGTLEYLPVQPTYKERTREVRIIAELDACYNILRVISVDTIETGQKVIDSAPLGGYWTIRLEYLRTPAKKRPKGFMVSQLDDGNWVTHSGKYATAKEAEKALPALLKKYPAWCKMYVFKLPAVTNQGKYI